MKTDTGHARRNLADLRQKAVRVFCAKRNIYKRDFAILAHVSLSTLYRFLRGETLFEPFERRIKDVLLTGNAVTSTPAARVGKERKNQ